MKKILFIIVLVGLCISCEKDDDQIESDDLSNFLESETPQFSAVLGDDDINWEFGFETYQYGMSYIFAGDGPNDPRRILRFILYQENGNNQFIIQTPVYNTFSDEAVNNVFGIGPKNIGNSNDDFFISLTNNDDSYSICESDSNYQIEILKTEEIASSFDDQVFLNVWFKIEDLELNTCDPEYDKTLTNGLILAKFTGHRF